MFNKSKKAFSFVELIVVITILVILGAIGVSMNDGYKEKTYNTKVITDLSTIENALIRYKQENSFIPSPEGNLKYFTNDGSYAHDETDAYGVHGFITETTIPKKYINIFPKDPKSKQYYAYGKTISGGFFEVSGVLSYRDKFESVVVGNYEGKDPLYNLIREYNGPDFVYNKSQKNFPYNPDEMILTAKISSFTGDLILNNNIIDRNVILERQLIPGDNIKLSTGSTATIYYSDGTVSYLGDNETPLELTLSVMKYKKDDNLFTRIRLALNFGTILTKASKMSTESKFDLYTTDTEASVRGTIFEIKRIEGENKTHIKVIKGSIFLNAINLSSYQELLKKLEKDQEISPKYPITPPIPDYTEIVSVNGIEESILKEGGEITIDGNTDTFQSIVNPDTCNLDEHMTTGSGCQSNIESCDIKDSLGNIIGEGNKAWNITDRGDCRAISCIGGYELQLSECVKENTCAENEVLNGSVCIPKIKTNVSCIGLPNNASWNNVNIITQNWDGNKYTPLSVGVYNPNLSNSECRFKCKNTFSWNGSNCVCPTLQHIEGGICKSNTISCSIINGTGQKTRDTTTSTRGTCEVVTCNSTFIISGNTCICPSGKHQSGLTCVSNTLSCTITNGIGQQTWNFATSNWGSCMVLSCNSPFVKSLNTCVCPSSTHLLNGSCVSNTRNTPCGGTFPSHALRTTSITYTQIWNGIIRTPSTKNRGYYQNECGFRCDSTHSRIGGICKANSIPVSGYGCNSCPIPNVTIKEYYSNCSNSFFGNSNIYQYKCTGVIGATACKIETNSHWGCPEDYAEPMHWSGTYTP
ncbi:MAG: FecR domain-containing protein [Candidatus Gracilibacteria bacterium]